MSLIATRPQSLIGKLRDYFRENPNDELSLADICIKFDVTYRAAVSAVDRLKFAGGYETVHVVRLKFNAKQKEVA